MKKLDLSPNRTYLIAVSFGPDSMALLHLARIQGLRVIVAHVNYHKRPESNLEQDSLEQYCLSFDIPLFVLDVRHKPKGNFQSWARDVRYRFFKEIYDAETCDVLLTGHQQDDFLETALFQMKRGVFTDYLGIKQQTQLYGMTTVRPLLDCSKKEILTFCESNQIPYAIDASNLGTDYTRNQIRHLVLAKYTSNQRNELLQEIAAKNKQLSNKLANLSPLIEPQGLLVQRLIALNDEDLFLVIKSYFDSFGLVHPISRAFLNQIRGIMVSAKPNWEKSIDSKLFIKNYDRLQLVIPPSVQRYRVKFKGKVIDHACFYLEPNHSSRPDWLESGLLIRNPEAGDRVLIKGVQRKVNRLFVDWKMPFYLRRYWPVFSRPNGQIVHIPRYQSHYQKFQSDWFFVKTQRMV